METEKSISGITIGDPAGIGPEITAKSLAKKEIYERCRPLVIGDADVFKKALDVVGENIAMNVVESPADGKYEFGTVDLIDLNNIDIDELEFGEVQAQCGKAAFEYIKTAVELAKQKRIKAIATAPINKESLKLAEVPYIGHTEML